ncbi:hypothetical protein [Escherichia coli]|uniref:hypothetical protein n=1 Tax=Escherichia coli TaxID=562 RepID=UPI001AEC7A53|nr:hypothetical protein [Escherichia coli]MBP2745301.1 hypothetical protein [Escherichia coli]
MVNVTQESLAARIAELESGPRSLKEDFALEAYRMLLPHIAERELADRERKATCSHDFWEWTVGERREAMCLNCGEKKSNG